MMTDGQILNLFKDCDFEHGISYDNFDYAIIDCMPDDFPCTYACGVSKLAVLPEEEDFVIKIPFKGRGLKCDDEFVNANRSDWHYWDYCYTELMYYHEAKVKHHAAAVLAKPHFIGYVHGYPIYVQQKAETFKSRYGDSFYYKMDDSADSRRKQRSVQSICDSYDMDTFNMKWLTDVFDYYGSKQFNEFMNFINMIEDLHDNNVGYIGDRPVIIDFSDWYD